MGTTGHHNGGGPDATAMTGGRPAQRTHPALPPPLVVSTLGALGAGQSPRGLQISGPAGTVLGARWASEDGPRLRRLAENVRSEAFAEEIGENTCVGGAGQFPVSHKPACWSQISYATGRLGPAQDAGRAP